MSSYGDYSAPPTYVSPAMRRLQSGRMPGGAPAQDGYGGFPHLGGGVYGDGPGMPSPGQGLHGGPMNPFEGIGQPPPLPDYGPPPPGALAGQNPSSYGSGIPGGNDFIGPGGQFNANQGVGALIPQYYNFGAFDPTGGGAYLDAIKADLAQQEAGDITRAGLQSDIYGGNDPLSAMYGRLNAQQAAANRYPAIIARARAEAAARREAYVEQLLSQRLGAVTYQHTPRTNYGAIAGQLAGAVVGAGIGGPAGAGIGAGIGGSAGGAAGGAGNYYVAPGTPEAPYGQIQESPTYGPSYP